MAIRSTPPRNQTKSSPGPNALSEDPLKQASSRQAFYTVRKREKGNMAKDHSEGREFFCISRGTPRVFFRSALMPPNVHNFPGQTHLTNATSLKAPNRSLNPWKIFQYLTLIVGGWRLRDSVCCPTHLSWPYWDVDYWQFGSPFKKPTRFYGRNHLTQLPLCRVTVSRATASAMVVVTNTPSEGVGATKCFRSYPDVSQWVTKWVTDRYGHVLGSAGYGQGGNRDAGMRGRQ